MDQDKPNRIRLAPEKPFPSYAFIPGKHPHPNQPGGHSYGEKGSNLILGKLSPLETREFLFSLDLINHGFFWESHEVLEELWNACERAEPYNSFLKGLIKIAAAGVKLNTASPGAAQGHLKRAKEHFEKAFEKENELGGFTHNDFEEFLNQQQLKLPFQILLPQK